MEIVIKISGVLDRTDLLHSPYPICATHHAREVDPYSF